MNICMHTTAFAALAAKAGVGSIGYKPSYIFKNQQIKRDPHTRNIRGLLPTGKFSSMKCPKISISKIPHTRTHTMIFDLLENSEPRKITNFGHFKKSPHAYTYEDFCPVGKFSTTKNHQFWAFLKIPTRVHIR